MPVIILPLDASKQECSEVKVTSGDRDGAADQVTSSGLGIIHHH